MDCTQKKHKFASSMMRTLRLAFEILSPGNEIHLISDNWLEFASLYELERNRLHSWMFLDSMTFYCRETLKTITFMSPKMHFERDVKKASMTIHIDF